MIICYKETLKLFRKEKEKKNKSQMSGTLTLYL